MHPWFRTGLSARQVSDLQSAPGVPGYEVHNREVRWSDGVPGETVVPCTGDNVALGGGFVAEGIRGGSADVKASEPVYDGTTATATGWKVTGTGVGEANVKAWVICAAN